MTSLVSLDQISPRRRSWRNLSVKKNSAIRKKNQKLNLSHQYFLTEMGYQHQPSNRSNASSKKTAFTYSLVTNVIKACRRYILTLAFLKSVAAKIDTSKKWMLTLQNGGNAFKKSKTSVQLNYNSLKTLKTSMSSQRKKCHKVKI